MNDPTPGNRVFLESEIGIVGPDEALFHVIPVPFERTVSYGGGTGRGPRAILHASQQLELLDNGILPGRAGIHTRAEVSCSGPATVVLENLRVVVAEVVGKGKVPVVLGGEHTVTLGAVRGAENGFGRNFGIVQIDAHADLRDRYEGDRYSHACVMRRIAELGHPIVQCGVRSMSEEERDYAAAMGIRCLDSSESLGREDLLPAKFPENVYVTIDVDGFDPSVIPATGTPEPGGLSWADGISVLANIARTRNVIGFDVVELAPVPGLHYAEFTAARIIYRLMGEIVRRKGG